ncbi:hypothetical protein [Planctomonas deserti]|uniref:hypothetical protein n=1 Tax=Planctomonas deserti TaxID=2144185 RepID=UPI00131F2328|nr:hypothetical protein [Planctomonas deserti]
MTVNEPGGGTVTPLSRRQLRELERRRALEEAGMDPDAPEAAVRSAAPAEGDGPTAYPGVDTDDVRSVSAGYEELTRELTPDRMLSRRELRALSEAREAQRRASVDAAPTGAASDPIETEHAEHAEDAGDTGDTEDTEDTETEAEHEALLGGTPPATAAEREAESEAEHDALLRDTGSPDAPAPDLAAGLERPAAPPLTPIPGADGHRDADAHPDTDPVEPVLDAADGDGDRLITSPVVYGSTPEHWSSADEELAVSTSTIVLPAPSGTGEAQHTPVVADEVIVTGTIDLPRGLAATGGHPDRYDSAEIDRLIDAADGVDQFEAEAEPVRAVRSATARPAYGGAVRVAPRRGVTLPYVLASTGGVLLVGVGALLVVALGIR